MARAAWTETSSSIRVLRGFSFCKNWHSCAESLQSHPTLYDPVDRSPPGSSVHGILPGKHTGVRCHVLLQGIFLTQEWNLHLLPLFRPEGRNGP